MKTPSVNSRILKLEVLKDTATRTSVNAVESRTTLLESDVATAQGDISTLQGDVATLTQGIQDSVSTHNTAPDAHADIRTLVAGKQDSLTISDVGEAMLALATPSGQKIPRVNADGSVVLINVPSGDGVGGSSWYASDDGPPSVDFSLSWVSNGDANGVFRALGTESGTWSNPASSGRIRSLASSIYEGAVELLTDRTTTNTPTNNVANSWFAFDLGVGTTLALDSYSLQGRGSDPWHQLRTWVIQGSNDVSDWTSAGISAATWTTIDSRTGDPTISGAGVWGHWAASVRSAPYRFIQIMQTGANSSGEYYLCLSEVELYGLVSAPVAKPAGTTGWARNSELIDDATAWMPYYATSALNDGTPIFGTAYDVASAVSTHNTATAAHADIRTALAGKQDAGNFAGSSTPGGAATTALSCTGNAATATTAASCTGNSATATTASSCSGNAATATKLATPRTLTIGSKENTFDGSADKAWTLADIGAVPTLHITTPGAHAASVISVFSSEKIDSTTVQEAVSEFEKKNNYKPLARWFSNVSARVLSGQTVNVWAGVDSLTAGAGGYSWLQPFRLMVQEALGDGGIGLEPPCADWEFGIAPLYYVGASVEEADPSVNDDRRYGVGIQTLTSQSSCYVSFNAGSSSSILRETDEVDVYYLKFPSGGTSMSISASPNGQFYSDVNSCSATNSVGKVALTGFGIWNGWAGSNIVVDSQNGPWRILGFNMKRTCPTGGARVHFWAKGGSTVQKWASLDSSSQQYYFGDIGCDLMILNGGMNDRNSRTKEQYKSDVQTIITNVRSANSNSAIVLVMPTIPSGDPGNLVEYRSALIELAESYDCAFIDTVWILGTNISAVANGLISGDSVHPTERGYRAIAEYIFNFLGGGALSQLKSCSYNKWAPRRDVDATSVQGWKPGSILSVGQDFSGRVRCGRIQNYYADNICRSYNLSEVVIPETPASSSVKIYDIGLIAGYCVADVELEVTLHRAGTGSRVRRKFYIAVDNWTVTDNATGYVRTENALIFKNLASDYADIDVQCSVINNTTTGRCEIYITPTGGSSPYTSFHGIVTKSQLVFARNVIASEEAVYEH